MPRVRVRALKMPLRAILERTRQGLEITIDPRPGRAYDSAHFPIRDSSKESLPLLGRKPTEESLVLGGPLQQSYRDRTLAADDPLEIITSLRPTSTLGPFSARFRS